MMRALSKTFRSVKCSIANPNSPKLSSPSSPSLVSNSNPKLRPNSKSASWCVYLIIATNHPIKTYVGVATNFTRLLKQHNGEIKGGAKASRAGRPWICACVICGFTDRSEACVFESKWKAFSRRVPQKKQNKQIEDASLALLQRRQEALNRVKRSLDCNHLEINWHLNLF
ncbi:structure-specific endonuclease subunit slx1 isoform X1 [Prosopis cineraria]|uniref:structure-specific endonuclease subunit slx1 isoform X1 n=1 Tax=Prosopis cineraria TaxID=364024 RepID=UPI002410074B|nr:structure-specific endonuclease subunit slx1 isoform X1 [Prosopis cineraria]